MGGKAGWRLQSGENWKLGSICTAPIPVLTVLNPRNITAFLTWTRWLGKVSPSLEIHQSSADIGYFLQNKLTILFGHLN